MVDNPFANKPKILLLEIKPPELPSIASFNKPPEPSKERLPDPEPISKEEKLEKEKNLATVRRVLLEHNGLESDIPTNHPEYWDAKGRL